MATMDEQSAPTAGPPVPRDAKAPNADYVAPSTELEAALARDWSERLNVAPVGVNDDFFELGGHSILATELLLQVQRGYGVEISARTLFLAPTVAEFARAISTARNLARQDPAR